MIDVPIKFAIQVREALAWIGVFAHGTKTPEGQEAAQILAKLAASFGEKREAVIGVPPVQVLCALADEFRALGETEAVADIERVVALLKQGPRVVKGTLQFGAATPGEMWGKLEQLGNTMIAAKDRSSP